MTSGWRLRRRVLAAVLTTTLGAAALLTAPSAVAEPSTEADGTSIAPAGPLLEKPQKGSKAIAELGDDLRLAADRNDLRPAELRALLRTDDTVWLDTEGLVYFVDPAPDTPGLVDEPAPQKVAPLAETFALHSNPGANRTIVLDFDGAAVTGTAWNIQSGVTAGNHPAWDPAGDGPAFSNSERLQVQLVWAMVAEDYAPFNVDVTTEDVGADRVNRNSSADSVYGTRVLVTPSDDPHAKLCARGCGGIAYLSVFDRVGDGYQPAWVFPQALGNSAKNIAEAASHEAGHNLGLEHDGTSTQGYYTGHGVWAPIMGVGYNKPLVQWSAGSYGSANNQQDDVNILNGYLGARPDEASDSISTPAPLPDGNRFIGTRSDVDAYLLGACTNGSTVTVAPADVGPNLDVRAVLYDASGIERAVSQPASGPGDGTTAGGLGAAVTVSGAGEGWVLAVEGDGQGTWGAGGYDDYGSLGAYTVEAPGCDGALADGAPTEPVDVAAGSAGQDTATFSWSAPSSAAGGPVTGYVVSRSGSTASQTLSAEARNHTFIGLAPGTTYQFSVRAVNAVGAGPSVTVTATTAVATPAAPSAPRDVTGSYNQALKQIEAWWVEPASAGTQPISAYAVYLDGVYLGQLGSPSRGAFITNPAGFSEGEHIVGVAAVNAVGASPIATVEILVDLPDRPANDDVANAQQLTGTSGSVPGDNTNATKEAVDPTPPTPFVGGGFSVWYTWTPAADGAAQMATSGGGINRDTTLAVYTGEPGSLVQVAGNDDSSEFHAALAFDAQAGARYLIAVDGFTSAGGTGPFNLAWEQTVPKVPNAPGAVSAARGDGSATVSWTEPSGNGSPITGYVVTTSPGGATKSVDADATSTVVSGLTNGTAYSFTVRAINAVGGSAASEASNEVVPAGVPDQLVKPAAVRGDQSATVTWTEPEGNGSPVTGYVVTTSPGSGTKTVEADAASTTISDLTNGTAYSFTIKAVNAVGSSAASEASNEVVPAGTPDTPTKPAVVRGDGSATVSWDKPSGNGSPITGYVVTTSGNGTKTVDADATSTTVSGLTNGTTYSFTVTAVNAVGSSAASESSGSVTPAGVPGRATIKVVKGDKVATLSWTAPTASGSAITKYTIRDGSRVFSAAGSATSLKISGLTNGRAYDFTLSATNAVGEGPVSAKVTATPSGRPVAPQRPTAKAGKRHATIAWKAPSANGTAITSYRVRRSDGTVRVVKGTVRSYKWTGLKKGKKYSFTIYAVNQVGTSGASPASSKVKIK